MADEKTKVEQQLYQQSGSGYTGKALAPTIDIEVPVVEIEEDIKVSADAGKVTNIFSALEPNNPLHTNLPLPDNWEEIEGAGIRDIGETESILIKARARADNGSVSSGLSAKDSEERLLLLGIGVTREKIRNYNPLVNKFEVTGPFLRLSLIFAPTKLGLKNHSFYLNLLSRDNKINFSTSTDMFVRKIQVPNEIYGFNELECFSWCVQTQSAFINNAMFQYLIERGLFTTLEANYFRSLMGSQVLTEDHLRKLRLIQQHVIEGERKNSVELIERAIPIMKNIRNDLFKHENFFIYEHHKSYYINSIYKRDKAAEVFELGDYLAKRYPKQALRVFELLDNDLTMNNCSHTGNEYSIAKHKAELALKLIDNHRISHSNNRLAVVKAFKYHWKYFYYFVNKLEEKHHVMQIISRLFNHLTCNSDPLIIKRPKALEEVIQALECRYGDGDDFFVTIVLKMSKEIKSILLKRPQVLKVSVMGAPLKDLTMAADTKSANDTVEPKTASDQIDVDAKKAGDNLNAAAFAPASLDTRNVSLTHMKHTQVIPTPTEQEHFPKIFNLDKDETDKKGEGEHSVLNRIVILLHRGHHFDLSGQRIDRVGGKEDLHLLIVFKEQPPEVIATHEAVIKFKYSASNRLQFALNDYKAFETSICPNAAEHIKAGEIGQYYDISKMTEWMLDELFAVLEYRGKLNEKITEQCKALFTLKRIIPTLKHIPEEEQKQWHDVQMSVEANRYEIALDIARRAYRNSIQKIRGMEGLIEMAYSRMPYDLGELLAVKKNMDSKTVAIRAFKILDKNSLLYKDAQKRIVDIQLEQIRNSLMEMDVSNRTVVQSTRFFSEQQKMRALEECFYNLMKNIDQESIPELLKLLAIYSGVTDDQMFHKFKTYDFDNNHYPWHTLTCEIILSMADMLFDLKQRIKQEVSVERIGDPAINPGAAASVPAFRSFQSTTTPTLSSSHPQHPPASSPDVAQGKNTSLSDDEDDDPTPSRKS